jgi:hypothetical protein
MSQRYVLVCGGKTDQLAVREQTLPEAASIDGACSDYLTGQIVSVDGAMVPV